MRLTRFLWAIVRPPVYWVNWTAFSQLKRPERTEKARYPNASRTVANNAKALARKRAEWKSRNVVKISDRDSQSSVVE